ncbi:MAG TPA: hypothetical protein VFO85_11180, partial [Vicinamibacteria bacterium]|nr:hypothetical protein [Vicinamibacteria bacterium]
RQGHDLDAMVRMQGAIWHYHAELNASHPYFSKWYTWPWLVRPTWYYFTNQGGSVRGMVAIGNPALWWVSVPVSVWAVAAGLAARRPERAVAGLACGIAGFLSFQAGDELAVFGLVLMAASLAVLALAGLGARSPVPLFTGLGFFALYLPWGISPRTLNYSHYLFEAIPYACLSLGLLLDRLWAGRLRALVAVYLALVLALLVLFFPLLTALPVPADWFNKPFLGLVRPWTWFPSWT